MTLPLTAELRQHALPERLDERAEVLAHVVEVDLLEAQLGELLEPGGVPGRVGRDQDGLAHVLRAHVRSGLVELLHRLEVPGERRAEYVRSPLVVRDAERLLLAVRPAEVDLEVDGLALAAALPEGADHTLERGAGLVDRHQPVGPLAAPARRLLAHRRADQVRRVRWKRPQTRPVDADEPVVVHGLAGEQRAHDVHALAQARVPLGLRRPPVAGDVLVRCLAGSERDPEPAREQLAERGGRLRDDRRVVALARSVDDAEGQIGGLKRRAQERPREPGLALALAPRREVVRRHGGAKAGGLSLANVPEQAAGRDLLVRAVEADDGHR